LEAAGSTVCFAEDLSLFTSLKQVLQYALSRFSAACDKANMKISTKIAEVTPENPGNARSIRIGKATQFCVSFIAV